MGHDINLKCSECGARKLESSIYITYNLSPMLHAAGFPERQFQNWADAKTLAGNCVPILKRTLTELKRDPEKYKPFNPENGWGSYDALVGALTELIAGCEHHPDCVFYDWY